MESVRRYVLDTNRASIRNEFFLLVVPEHSCIRHSKQVLLLLAFNIGICCKLCHVGSVSLCDAIVQLCVLDLVEVEQFRKVNRNTLHERRCLLRCDALNIRVHHLSCFVDAASHCNMRQISVLLCKRATYRLIHAL